MATRHLRGNKPNNSIALSTAFPESNINEVVKTTVDPSAQEIHVSDFEELRSIAYRLPLSELI
jgi:hypothetical protein